VQAFSCFDLQKKVKTEQKKKEKENAFKHLPTLVLTLGIGAAISRIYTTLLSSSPIIFSQYSSEYQEIIYNFNFLLTNHISTMFRRYFSNSGFVNVLALEIGID
jgi:hypothetical protein